MDALIVGAGPTGLTLGCELLKRGLSVSLIDKLETPSPHSRALGVQARTLELFEKMGLSQAFLEKGHPISSLLVHTKTEEIGSLHLNQLPTDYPFVLIIPQVETEKILTAHFESLGGHIERGVSFKQLQDKGALLSHSNGSEESVECKWIFGCDGAHSTIREALNLEFKGEEFPETFLLADLKIKSPFTQEKAHLFLYPGQTMALFPFKEEGHYRFVLAAPKGKINSTSPLNKKVLAPYLRSLSSHPISIEEIEWATFFSVHRRITPTMRKDHIFLLGDAAHIHSPLGGQGLNTSVQDAFNLAWKIELVHKGFAKEALLNSFEEERLSVAKQLLKATTWGTRLITFKKLKPLLFFILKTLIKKRSFKRKITRGISELDIGYPQSTLLYRSKNPIGDPLPVGSRAPNIPLDEGKSLFEHLKHPGHILLIFADKPQADELENALKAHTLPPLQIVHINSGTLKEGAKFYQTKAPCFYIIRPDGIIGCSSCKLDPDEIVTYFAHICR